MNPQRWAWTVLVYYYDEHGGFHDHVAPPPVGYNTRANPAHVFDSLGPRVAAVVVSRALPVEGRRQLRAEEGGRGGLTRRR